MRDPVWAREAQTRQHLARLEVAAALWELYRDQRRRRRVDARMIGYVLRVDPMRLIAYLRATGRRSDQPREDEPRSRALLDYYRRMHAAEERNEREDDCQEYQGVARVGTTRKAGRRDCIPRGEEEEVMKQAKTPGGRSVRDRIAGLLHEQPMTVTAIGARTGYEYGQLIGALRKLRLEGRASPVLGGWIAGGEINAQSR